VLFWVEEGVKIFRVDNPHTKPLPVLGMADRRHPRARTRKSCSSPKPSPRRSVMYRLAKVGFSQSYTYFTWRNTKRELTQYLTELNEGAGARILPAAFLRQHAGHQPGVPARIRAPRPSDPRRAGNDAPASGACIPASSSARRRRCRARRNTSTPRSTRSARDFTAPGNIIAEITQLNRIRRQNPALQTHLGLKVYNAWNDNIMYFGKREPDRSNFMLVAVSLDPHNGRRRRFRIAAVGNGPARRRQHPGRRPDERPSLHLVRQVSVHADRPGVWGSPSGSGATS
jgi:starch synthase (maltosyl-transferring)